MRSCAYTDVHRFRHLGAMSDDPSNGNPGYFGMYTVLSGSYLISVTSNKKSIHRQQRHAVVTQCDACQRRLALLQFDNSFLDGIRRD